MTRRRDDEPRVWAIRDRSLSPPQRKLARHRLAISGTHFRRQVQIGRYIVDFASHGAKLVIEVDGGQHAEASSLDLERTRLLEANGYRVLRFWNNEVLANVDGVLETIQHALTSTPTPDVSPQEASAPTERASSISGKERSCDPSPSRLWGASMREARRGGGRHETHRTTPTPDPSPQGGGE